MDSKFDEIMGNGIKCIARGRERMLGSSPQVQDLVLILFLSGSLLLPLLPVAMRLAFSFHHTFYVTLLPHQGPQNKWTEPSETVSQSTCALLVGYVRYFVTTQ